MKISARSYLVNVLAGVCLLCSPSAFSAWPAPPPPHIPLPPPPGMVPPYYFPDLDRRNPAFEQALKEVRAELQALRATMNDLHASLDAEKTLAGTLQQELAALRAAHAAELSAIQQENQALLADQDIMKSENKTLYAELQKALEKRPQNERTDQELQNENKEIVHELDEKQKQLRHANARIESLDHELAQLRSQIDKRGAAFSALETEFTALKNTHSTAQESMQDARSEVEQLSNQYQALSSESETKDQQLAALAAERDRLLLYTRDSDSDGVADAVDRCSDTPKDVAVDSAGCIEDSDLDGIADAKDLCPESDQGSQVDATGCVSGESIILTGVNFQYNSAAFTPATTKTLDGVGRVLLAHPEIKAEVAGYTDNYGPDETNLVLSQQRADAVKHYLLAGGIPQNRLVARGYGEVKPIANNRTREGRAKNRRVELHILVNH